MIDYMFFGVLLICFSKFLKNKIKTFFKDFFSNIPYYCGPETAAIER